MWSYILPSKIACPWPSAVFVWQCCLKLLHIIHCLLWSGLLPGHDEGRLTCCGEGRRLDSRKMLRWHSLLLQARGLVASLFTWRGRRCWGVREFLIRDWALRGRCRLWKGRSTRRRVIALLSRTGRMRLCGCTIACRWHSIWLLAWRKWVDYVKRSWNFVIHLGMQFCEVTCEIFSTRLPQ